MTKKQLILGLAGLVALVALAVWGRDRIHFDFGVFRAQLAQADWGKIGIALACIYTGYLFRSVRWAVLLRHSKRVPLFSLLGTQVIGFTAVALIGRVADPVRPYLVAKKTGLTLTSQIAVYIVERLFDAGSMAVLFSSAILFAPAGTLPHPETFRKFGYGGLAGAAVGALFLVALRIKGEEMARIAEKVFSKLSAGAGHAVANKMRTFHTGLDTLRSFSDFAIAFALSIAMWGLITITYLETALAFVAPDHRASVSLPKCMVLMVSSGAASAVQLPVIGWFTQIGAVMLTMRALFTLSTEAATACAATLLLVSFLAIVPVGLVWAQVEHISLRKVAVESECAEAELVADEPAG